MCKSKYHDELEGEKDPHKLVHFVSNLNKSNHFDKQNVFQKKISRNFFEKNSL